MKVLIGVDPHKATVTVAVMDELAGEFVECATFPQNRAGLRALQRWAKRFPKRRWAVENAGGLGRHLAGRFAKWEGGKYNIEITENLTPELAEGIGFQAQSLEMWQAD
jgi:hypothetical protein